MNTNNNRLFRCSYECEQRLVCAGGQACGGQYYTLDSLAVSAAAIGSNYRVQYRKHSTLAHEVQVQVR